MGHERGFFRKADNGGPLKLEVKNKVQKKPEQGRENRGQCVARCTSGFNHTVIFFVSQACQACFPLRVFVLTVALASFLRGDFLDHLI